MKTEVIIKEIQEIYGTHPISSISDETRIIRLFELGWFSKRETAVLISIIQGRTLKEIGMTLTREHRDPRYGPGITSSRVANIRDKALRKMRWRISAIGKFSADEVALCVFKTNWINSALS